MEFLFLFTISISVQQNVKVLKRSLKFYILRESLIGILDKKDKLKVAPEYLNMEKSISNIQP